MVRTRFPIGIMIFVLICLGQSGCQEMRRGSERAALRGKLIFELHCCGCHNGKISDSEKKPPNLAGIFERPSLPSGAPATDAVVRSTILEGRLGIMPSFQGSLTNEEIEDIIRYLHTGTPGADLCAAN